MPLPSPVETANPALHRDLKALWAPCAFQFGDRLLDLCTAPANGTLTNFGSQQIYHGSPYGRSIEFDGSDDYINFTAPCAKLESARFSFLIAYKLNTNLGASPLMFNYSNSGGPNGWYIYLLDVSVTDIGLGFATADGVGADNLETGSVTTPGSSNSNWRVALFTYDGVTKKIYVDGQIYASAAWAGPVDYSGVDTFKIGENGLTGRIAMMAHWGRALSSTEAFSITVDPLQLIRRAPPLARSQSIPPVPIDPEILMMILESEAMRTRTVYKTVPRQKNHYIPYVQTVINNVLVPIKNQPRGNRTRVYYPRRMRGLDFVTQNVTVQQNTIVVSPRRVR